MNLDLLKKLTKLANNNPNEHEANSAARRVCKMLEEGNFKLDPIKTAADKVKEHWGKTTSNSANTTGPIPNPFEDLFKGKWWGFNWDDKPGSWENVHRTTEPEFKSKPPEESSFKYEVHYYDEVVPDKEIKFKAGDWTYNKEKRTYKNNITNAEIPELEYYNKYGFHIKL